MTPPLSPPADEWAMRALAVDPAMSVFLSANAGSGKTTILTNRVIRLLLDGVEPDRILCVTYTKAAAAEMQNRIFDTLSGWVRLDDASLGAAIHALTGTAPPAPQVRHARQLFARAVETPGGLKIQTIHAFSERLLHLFPFEANVPFRFQVLDDVGKRELLDAARRQVVQAALASPQSSLGQAFAHVAAMAAEKTLTDLIENAVPLLREIAVPDDAAAIRQRTAAALGLPDGADAAWLERRFAARFDRALWAGRAERVAAEATMKSDLKWVEAMREAVRLPAREALAKLTPLYWKVDGTASKQPLNSAMVKAFPEVAEANVALAPALADLNDDARALETLEASSALVELADAVVARFHAAKTARSLVDFDDMIALTRRLVDGPGASWVLRKLDGGIDHVLIDEAQDTTPDMWEIMRQLTDEFFAGAGERQQRRTVFAVGDEKQSIYSFQGARPAEFDASRRYYQQRAAGAGEPFAAGRLNLSFRTVADVLDAVDATFSVPERYRGLSASPEPTVHVSTRRAAPGFVELWPVMVEPKRDPRGPWEEVDSPGHNSAQATLALRLARHIAHLIANDRFDDDGAPVRPGDIMILVQRRNSYFKSIIRALKEAGVPVAGADRMSLVEEQAVLDLIAAARTALMPEDDLTLATALKSPLIGLTDEDLIRFAPGRSGSLYQALAAQDDARFRSAAATVERWRMLARTLTPFAFFSTLLSTDGGRLKLMARLGPDAADGLAMFLASVRSREGRAAPSLQAEVVAFESLSGSIKRDQEEAGQTVRVMTVHGAKGLEARIVYLADATHMPGTKQRPSLYLAPVPGGSAGKALLWARGRQTMPQSFIDLREAHTAETLEEYRRLAYVAMTRARDRLYVAGWARGDSSGAAKPPPETCWYGMIEAGLDGRTVMVPDTTGEGEVARFRSVPLTEAPVRPLAPATPAQTPMPAWIAHPAPAEPVATPPLRPSHAGHGDDVPLSPERERARERGDLVHALMERLPPMAAVKRPAAARSLLASLAPGLAADQSDRLADAAIAVIEGPETARLFGPDSRAEVAVAGTVPLPGGLEVEVAGRIDRLSTTAAGVAMADIKTGMRPATGPRPADVLQLALYRALIMQIYPGRHVETLIVWTRTASAERLDDADLEAALARLAARMALDPTASHP